MIFREILRIHSGLWIQLLDGSYQGTSRGCRLEPGEARHREAPFEIDPCL